MRKDELGPTPSDQCLEEIIVVAFGTGLRRGELLNLQWRDVDLENGHLFVRHRGDFKPKNGQERAVSLVGGALEMLRAIHEAQNPIPNEPVFTDENGESLRKRGVPTTGSGHEAVQKIRPQGEAKRP
jgi:integrase